MDSRAPTSELLARLARIAPDDAILWRGPPAPGSDVDLLVLSSALPALGRELHSLRLEPSAGDPGHVVWRDPAGRTAEVDVLPARRWPAAYPSLEGLRARATRSEAGLALAAPEDRLLIFSADALEGRPVEKIAARAIDLLRERGVRERLERVAEEEGLGPLAALIGDPSNMLAHARRGRLPYGVAARLALRSRAARVVLRKRLAARLGARPRGPIVAFSGMDGAGKSTAVREAVAALEEAGLAAGSAWARFGQEAAILNALASPVKRLLGARGTVADPVAAGGPGVEKVQDVREATGRRRPISWAWVVCVAAVNARSLRHAARGRRDGLAVVCDRWLIDSLVDLRLRYGPHRLAELVLRAAVPRPDLAFLLSLDAETAVRRKPGDQDPHVLRRAAGLYEEEARRRGAVQIDASGSREEVARQVADHLRRVL